MDTLKTLSKVNSVTLHWVKARAGHELNEKTDALAKSKTRLNTESIPPIPRSLSKQLVKKLFIYKWTDRWSRTSTCWQTKYWVRTPGSLPHWAHNNCETFSLILQASTGHNYLNYHETVMGNIPTNLCRFCREECGEFRHLAHECPALTVEPSTHSWNASRRSSQAIVLLTSNKQTKLLCIGDEVGHFKQSSEQNRTCWQRQKINLCFFSRWTAHLLVPWERTVARYLCFGFQSLFIKRLKLAVLTVSALFDPLTKGAVRYTKLIDIDIVYMLHASLWYSSTSAIRFLYFCFSIFIDSNDDWTPL